MKLYKVVINRGQAVVGRRYTNKVEAMREAESAKKFFQTDRVKVVEYNERDFNALLD